MARTIFLVPLSKNVGLNSISLGLIKSLEEKGAKVGYMVPVSNDNSFDSENPITNFLKEKSIDMVSTLSVSQAEKLVAANKKDDLLEEVIASYHQISDKNDIVLVQGANIFQNLNALSLNYDLAKTLNADIIFVSSANQQENLKEAIVSSINDFDKLNNLNILGLILNKVNAPTDEIERFDIEEAQGTSINLETLKIELAQENINLISGITWEKDLVATKVSSIAKYLDATVINEGEMNSRRVTNLSFCSKSVENVISRIKNGSFLVLSADRPEILIAASLASMSGVKIAGILLTGSEKIHDDVLTLCKEAFKSGLPVLAVKTNTWQTSFNIHNMEFEISDQDYELTENAASYVASKLDKDFLASLIENKASSARLSPPAFKYQLTELSMKAGKAIVLPEGDEPRTVKAAILAAQRGIAKCVLLADKASVEAAAKAQNLELPESNLVIVNPSEVRENYVARLVELRKNKGMTEDMARDQLGDNVVLGTMMLEMGEVDGLVSGAVHTTANTIRPPLQLIKTCININ
ncbi:MAG: phosphate acetyltransferase, partial [Psittacicella sp.]